MIRAKTWVAPLLLTGWAIVLLVVIAALSLRHVASLPVPNDQARLTSAAMQLRRAPGKNFLVHVIDSDCSCARSLFSHLVTRRPFRGVEELILFVGADPDKQRLAERSGFEFAALSGNDLVTRFGIEAAPVLLVFDASGRLRYAGGYYDRPAAITPLDERIHKQLDNGDHVAPLPVFGCAVSQRLREALNPLRLRFSK